MVLGRALCNATANSVAPLSTAQEEKKVMVAPSFPQGAPAEALLAEVGAVASVSQDSIAHLAAGAIIDTALDYRLYRRADVFASKYYSFGGPERYAEARFLHACDTVTKCVKKRHFQVIDKQIERVDEMVARVSKDLKLTPPSADNGSGRGQFHGDDIPIETMSDHIRDFSLRRLRASNMHAAAKRLARVWGLQYSHDPLQLANELEERRLT